MIDVDPKTKDEDDNYHVDLRLPCGMEITVLVPSKSSSERMFLTEESGLRKVSDPIGLNLVFRGHYH